MSGTDEGNYSYQQPQMVLPGDIFVDAYAVFSLALKVLATVLMGYNAWCVPLTSTLRQTCRRTVGTDIKHIYALYRQGT